MSDFKNDYSVATYTHNGKKYYEVKVQQRDKFGKIRKKSSRFTKNGRRLTSQAMVTQVKIWLREDLKVFLNQKSIYSWRRWKESCIMKMRNEGLKESTLKNYDTILDKWKDPAWDDMFLSDIDRDVAYKYFQSYLINKGASDWTRQNIHKRIHRLFELALEDGEISRNPTRGIKINAKSSEGVAFTQSEVEILLTQAKKSNHYYYPHWVVALLTGLRNGELSALRYSKINFDSNTILIDEQFTSKDGLHLPKKGKTRTIDLGPELKEFILMLRKTEGLQKAELWKHIAYPIEIDEIIGGSKTGRKIPSVDKRKEYVEIDDLVLPRIRSWTQGGQARELREFCSLIGIREAKFHDLRATHITNLLSNGVSISKVMHQVGHSQMSTTDAYHRLAGVEVRGITEKLGFDVPKAPEPNDDDNVVQLFPKRATGL